MKKLYPLKFKPIFKEKIWGGDKIKTILNKDFSPLPNCGETWEISGVDENVSVVQNGFLAENTLNELMEIYMGDIAGERIYEHYGNKFPILSKFIDANDNLSIQVHPDNALARKRHNGSGKTEMWYVIQANPDAEMIMGFKEEVSKEEYIRHLKENSLEEILNIEKVKRGDVFFIPAGRVHAIGKGILLAEIQQSSDITYRIYDWDRTDAKGNKRELHTELALEAIDFKVYDHYKTNYSTNKNTVVNLVSCPYFTTNLLDIDKEISRDFINIDSFVAYSCVEGSAHLYYEDGKITIEKGDAILIPAEIKSWKIEPGISAKLLEYYIDLSTQDA